MGKELTERQAELLREVRLIDEHRKALRAEEQRLQSLQESAIRAAAVEGVRQRTLAQVCETSDSWISQIVNPRLPKVVRPWWTPDSDGISPRDEWRAWLAEHQSPDPPA